MTRLLPGALALLALSLVACGKGSGEVSTRPAPVSSTALLPPDEAQTGPTRKAEKAASTGERIKIAGGTMSAGSTPGDEGRDPTIEPTLLAVDLGPFEIDKLPFPNDPTKPPRTGVSRDEARTLCQQQKGRLCTELEWERACKGPAGDLYGAGNHWDPTCAREPNSCASGFGALALGGALREWTDSDMPGPEPADRRRAVYRGAPPTADAVDHRCAHRAAVDATARAQDLGFRCCYGPPNAAAVPPPKTGEASFTKIEVDLKKITKVLAASPRLAPYAKDLAFYKEEEAIKSVMARGDAGTLKPGPVLTTSPVLWTPFPTEEIVVTALRAKNAAIIAAFYRLPEDNLRLAASLVLKDEQSPVVLSFTSFNKKRVLWTTCWECNGEQGAAELRDGKRLVIAHY